MKGISRRTALLGAGALVASYSGWRLGASFLNPDFQDRPRGRFKLQTGKRPNILFVLTDQERARHLLPDIIPRPHHDRLMETSTVFRNASAVSNLCSLARGIIYTGQHPQHNGVWENTPLPYADALRSDIPTMGTVMQDAGYTTGYFGKWHMTHFPIGQRMNKEDVARIFAGYGFEYSDQDADRDGALAGWLHDPVAADGVSRFMHQMKGGEKPWFAAVNLVNPHDIMFYKTSQHQKASRASRLPDEIKSAPDDPIYRKNWGIPLPENFGSASLEGKPAAQFEMQKVMELVLGEIPLDRRDLWEAYNNYYYNCVCDMDRSLGTIVDELEQSGQADNTIVVYSSDHGEMGGVHGLREKGGNMYREDQNVPLLIRHPEITASRSVEALASHLDILPTMLGLAGIDEAQWRRVYPMLKGHDLSPVLSAASSQEQGPRQAHFAQWTSLAHLSRETVMNFSAIEKAKSPIEKMKAVDFGASLSMFENRGHMRGIQQGKYKFARYFSPLEHHKPEDFNTLVSNNDLELYDTALDPQENYNLANDLNGHRELITQLNAQLNSLIKDEIGVDDGSYLPGPSRIWRA